MKPKITRTELIAKLPIKIDFTKSKLFIIGIRGYYKNTMGVKGKNDINICDDAICILSEDFFETFNGNTDPSKTQKSIATLQPGYYASYRFDTHFGKVLKYPAICQRLGDVNIKREGQGDKIISGKFGINIHKGGYKTTSSLGCQTIHPDQWEDFYNKAKKQAEVYYKEKWNSETITYILIEN